MVRLTNVLLVFVFSICDYQVQCKACKALLQVQNPTAGLYGMTEQLDNGHLKYPSTEIIGICKLMCTFVSKVMNSPEVRQSGKLCSLLLSALLHYFTQCSVLTCDVDDADHAKASQKTTATFVGQLGRKYQCNRGWIVKLAQKPVTKGAETDVTWDRFSFNFVNRCGTISEVKPNHVRSPG